MANITLHQKLDNILLRAYFLEAEKLSNYSIKHLPPYTKKYGGLYDISTKTIVIQNDLSGCNELFLAASLHELSHHVEFMKYGYTKHDERFYEIYQRLLFASFTEKYVNPSKLYLAEEYLSYYADKQFVKKVCKQYMELFETKKYQLELTTIIGKAIEVSSSSKAIGFKKVYCDYSLWYKFEAEGKESEFIVKYCK